MKRLIFLFIFPFIVCAQTSVRTERASNMSKYYSAATSGDTVMRVGVNSVWGSYVVGIMFGEPVASDTVIIKNGRGTVATVVNTTDVKPYYLPIEARCDTSIIFIQKKASKTTFIYRQNY